MPSEFSSGETFYCLDDSWPITKVRTASNDVKISVPLIEFTMKLREKNNSIHYEQHGGYKIYTGAPIIRITINRDKKGFGSPETVWKIIAHPQSNRDKQGTSSLNIDEQSFTQCKKILSY